MTKPVEEMWTIVSLVEFQSAVELGENGLWKFTVGIYYHWHLPFGL